MFKRWFIRGIFAFPIVLCLLGWGWSSCHQCRIGYLRAGSMLEVGTWSGNLALAWGSYYPGVALDAQPEGWRFWLSKQRPEFVLPAQWHSLTFLGFNYHHDPGLAGYKGWTRVQVPYWFFIVLFSPVSVLVWRKTRHRKLGPAFPVVTKTNNS